MATDDLVEQVVLVEHVLDLGDQAHVLIVVPEGTNFALTDDSTLGGKPIHKWLSQPRALDENGKPRFDIFNIILKSRSDRAFFKEGDRPSLTVKPLPPQKIKAEQGVGGQPATPPGVGD